MASAFVRRYPTRVLALCWLSAFLVIRRFDGGLCARHHHHHPAPHFQPGAVLAGGDGSHWQPPHALKSSVGGSHPCDPHNAKVLLVASDSRPLATAGSYVTPAALNMYKYCSGQAGVGYVYIQVPSFRGGLLLDGDNLPAGCDPDEARKLAKSEVVRGPGGCPLNVLWAKVIALRHAMRTFTAVETFVSLDTDIVVNPARFSDALPQFIHYMQVQGHSLQQRPILLNMDNKCWLCGQTERHGVHCVTAGVIVLSNSDRARHFLDMWWANSMANVSAPEFYPTLHPSNWRTDAIGDQKLLTITAEMDSMRHFVQYNPPEAEGVTALQPGVAHAGNFWRGQLDFTTVLHTAKRVVSYYQMRRPAAVRDVPACRDIEQCSTGQGTCTEEQWLDCANNIRPHDFDKVCLSGVPRWHCFFVHFCASKAMKEDWGHRLMADLEDDDELCAQFHLSSHELMACQALPSQRARLVWLADYVSQRSTVHAE